MFEKHGYKMKGKNYIKIGFILITFGIVYPLLFILMDYLWDFNAGCFYVISILSFAIGESLGPFLIFYGKNKLKYDFSRRLQELIQEKGEVTPIDLERIEQEVFGSMKFFGTSRFGYRGGFILEDAYHILKQMWVTERVKEVIENES